MSQISTPDWQSRGRGFESRLLQRASGNDDLPKILFGGASTQIMDIDLMIRIDNEGNFTHVFYEGNWISVKTYNAIQREKDPNAYD